MKIDIKINQKRIRNLRNFIEFKFPKNTIKLKNIYNYLAEVDYELYNILRKKS